MKIYPVGLVGEANYQSGILRSHPGEVVRVYHERDNPYDERALRVENNVGDIIGYVPRSCWLHRAVHEDGLGIAATIKAISDGDGQGLFGVVLDVTLTDDPIFIREYMPPPRTTRKTATRKAALKSTADSEAIGLASGLIAMATVPLNCDCGNSYSHSYKGLSTTSTLRCPSCNATAKISEGDLDRLDAELHALLLKMLESQRLSALGIDVIRELRLAT